MNKLAAVRTSDDGSGTARVARKPCSMPLIVAMPTKLLLLLIIVDELDVVESYSGEIQLIYIQERLRR